MKNIIIIGAGFAGFWAAVSAKRLILQNNKADSINITLINPDHYLYIRPRFYETDYAQARVDINPYSKLCHFQLKQGFVTSINHQHKQVILTSGETLAFDALILASTSTAFTTAFRPIGTRTRQRCCDRRRIYWHRIGNRTTI
jgi:NADH:ubiquinone reductase (H+-translocating)